jgi:acyl carrier protein
MDMNKNTIEPILRLVEVQLGKLHISQNDKLVEDLGAESADIANIVAAVEDKYKIAIRESEIVKLSTASDLFALVQSKLNES